MDQNNENIDTLNTCYICSDEVENIVYVCKCRKICHLKCLHKWLTVSQSNTCDICKEAYIDLTPYYKIKSRVKPMIVSIIVITIIATLGFDALFLHYLDKILPKSKSTDSYALCIVGIILLTIYIFGSIRAYYKENRENIIIISNQFKKVNKESVAINVSQSQNTDTSNELTPLL
uniref:Uncharacterized protein n=1 Tax=viral metagenome TaxID=1070528 RepID=A0A6C0E847_9ZZZZ